MFLPTDNNCLIVLEPKKFNTYPFAESRSKYILKLPAIKQSQYVVPNILIDQKLSWSYEGYKNYTDLPTIRPEILLASYLLNANANPKSDIFNKIDKLFSFISLWENVLDENALLQNKIETSKINIFPRLNSEIQKISDSSLPELDLYPIVNRVSIKFYHPYVSAVNLAKFPQYDLHVYEHYAISPDDTHEFCLNIKNFLSYVKEVHSLIDSIFEEIEKNYQGLAFNFMTSASIVVDFEYLKNFIKFPPLLNLDEALAWDKKVAAGIIQSSRSLPSLEESIKSIERSPELAQLTKNYKSKICYVFCSCNITQTRQSIDVWKKITSRNIFFTPYPQEAYLLFKTIDSALNHINNNDIDVSEHEGAIYLAKYKAGELEELINLKATVNQEIYKNDSSCREFALHDTVIQSYMEKHAISTGLDNIKKTGKAEKVAPKSKI